MYLDEKYPEVPLQATDPLRRAQDKMLVENFAGVRPTSFKNFFRISVHEIVLLLLRLHQLLF